MDKEELYVSSPTSLSIGNCNWVAMDIKLVNEIEKIIKENKQLKEQIKELEDYKWKYEELCK